jgi:hypothetical protein
MDWGEGVEPTTSAATFLISSLFIYYISNGGATPLEKKLTVQIPPAPFYMLKVVLLVN